MLFDMQTAKKLSEFASTGLVLAARKGKSPSSHLFWKQHVHQNHADAIYAYLSYFSRFIESDIQKYHTVEN